MKVGLGLAAWVVLGSACLDDQKITPSVDSASHFLLGCVTDAQCPSELGCYCGVCTTLCATDLDCEPLDERATCLRADDLLCGFGSVLAGESLCGVACTSDGACGSRSCDRDHCVAEPRCPDGYAWDVGVGYCAGPWTDIESFSGNKACGPDYYFVTLPFGMNEFRPRAPSVVTGGFLAVISNLEQETLWSVSPSGETNVCNNLWGDDQGTWFQGVRRPVGIGPESCAAPQIPPPLGFYFRGCGIYDFSLQGRAIIPPLY